MGLVRDCMAKGNHRLIATVHVGDYGLGYS